MTVTSQPNIPKIPVVKIALTAQINIGKMIHLGCLKNSHKLKLRSAKTLSP